MGSDAMDIDQPTAPAVSTSSIANGNEDEFNVLSQRFMDWLRSRPDVDINPSIAIADFRSRGAGRGVITTTTLSADTPLFTIPHTSILSVSTSPLTTVHIPRTMHALDTTHPWLALVLAMIYETRPDSEWKPYMDILPREFDTLMYWDERVEVRELQGCAVVGKIGREEAERGFREVLGPVVEENWALFKDAEVGFVQREEGEGGEKMGVVEESLVKTAHRMASIIMSYSFDIEKPPTEQTKPHTKPTKTDPRGSADSDTEDDEEEDDDLPSTYKALIPLADMLNANSTLVNSRLFHNPTSVTMTVLPPPSPPIPPNTELLNDYGPLPRSDLLRRYGYITPLYSPYDVVEISSALIVDTILNQNNIVLPPEEKERRIERLLEEGWLEDDAVEFWADPAAVREGGEPEGEWWTETDDAVRCFQVLTAPPASSTKPKKTPLLETRHSPVYKSTILSILKARLEMYPSPDPAGPVLTPEEEEALSDTQRRRVCMAREVRAGEVGVLRNVMRMVEGWEVWEEKKKKVVENGGGKGKRGPEESAGGKRKRVK